MHPPKLTQSQKFVKYLSILKNIYIKVTGSVRQLLTQKDIYPEYLPSAEDIKKVGRKSKSEGKQLPRSLKIKKLKKSKIDAT